VNPKLLGSFLDNMIERWVLQPLRNLLERIGRAETFAGRELHRN
jgi:hypothetical protein